MTREKGKWEGRGLRQDRRRREDDKEENEMEEGRDERQDYERGEIE